MAKTRGVEIEVIVADGKFENVHGVTSEQIDAILDAWEE